MLRTILFLLVGYLAQASSDTLVEECSKETNVPINEIEKYVRAMEVAKSSNSDFPVPSQQLACFVACTLKRTQVMTNGGMLAIPEEQLKNEQRFVQCYKAVTETDICRRAVGILECVATIGLHSTKS